MDSRFALDARFVADPDEWAGAGASGSHSEPEADAAEPGDAGSDAMPSGEDDADELGAGMDPAGFAGPAGKVVKPLTPEALAAFNAAQARTGVVYISRIPPGMRPPKVRHLMSQYGEVARVYLQQEGALCYCLLLLERVLTATKIRSARTCARSSRRRRRRTSPRAGLSSGTKRSRAQSRAC
jgi:hypothetical protein